MLKLRKETITSIRALEVGAKPIRSIRINWNYTHFIL